LLILVFDSILSANLVGNLLKKLKSSENQSMLHGLAALLGQISLSPTLLGKHVHAEVCMGMLL